MKNKLATKNRQSARSAGVAALMLTAASLSGVPASGVGANDWEKWNAIARTFAAMLPAPMKGWSATKPEPKVYNSPFQKGIVGRRIYRDKAAPGTELTILIDGHPRWKETWTNRLFKNAALRTKHKMTMSTLAGRRAVLETKGRKKTYRILIDNRIVVLAAATNVTPEVLEAYLSKIDYKKLATIK